MMPDPRYPNGTNDRNLPNDDDICEVCGHKMGIEGDSDGVRMWSWYECQNPACPESSEFNEDDPREER
jgi:hypothetical protein